MSEKNKGHVAHQHRKKNYHSDNYRRTRFVEVVCGIAALVLIAGLFNIMILKHDTYQSAAVQQQTHETTVTAKRGTIYDSNMNILAMSASVKDIYLSPMEISIYNEDVDLICSTLSNILGLSYDEIKNVIDTEQDSWYSVIATKVDSDISDQVQAFIDTNELKGVRMQDSSQRYYPYGSLACHVIGFVGGEGDGMCGIEQYYNDTLSGTDGRIISVATVYGDTVKYTGSEDVYEAEDGDSLVLTINESVQYYLEQHLQEAVESYDLQDGAAGIVMDVNTGAVLGMASLGNYDLNDYMAISEAAQERVDAMETDEEKEEQLVTERETQWNNIALSQTYEPGSTFKIITLASALESGAITTDSTFYCGGSLNVAGRDTPLNCWQTSGHGSETLTQAAMNSCNVAFVNIGMAIGAERFYDYIRAFGLFEKTGIDLAGESGSIWWDDDVFTDPYNKSQLAAASFGQTFTITPLQLITAVSAVANGGYLMTPYIVDKVLDSDGNVISQTEPNVVRQVISEQTSEECCEILEQVVGNSAGTGNNAYVAGYRIAGKTGTSEDVVYEANHNGDKKYIVSFIGFAPADDPQVAVLVLLKNPGENASTYVSGGQMAAPTVGSIMADILPLLDVSTSYTEEEEAYVDKTVPRLTGDSLAEAEAQLDALGFSYSIIGDGEEVTAQLPRANSTIAAGSEVVLYCGVETGAEAVEMLDLTGLDYETARIRMGWSGLYIQGEGAMLGSNSYVTAQSVEPGEMVAVGSVVTVTLTDSSHLGRY